MRAGSTPSVAATSRPVYSELTKTVSQDGASRYFAACIEYVLGVTHSRWRSGTRSWIIVERRPPRCGGNIQSV
jgi:hypothetical protein